MLHHSVQVLTDSCATCALLRYNDSTLRYAINKENVALISDVKIIVDMLLSWRAWEKSADGVYLMALEALNSLVRTDHPHHQYNIEQYRRAGLVSKLLEICKVCVEFVSSLRTVLTHLPFDTQTFSPKPVHGKIFNIIQDYLLWWYFAACPRVNCLQVNVVVLTFPHQVQLNGMCNWTGTLQLQLCDVNYSALFLVSYHSESVSHPHT